MNYLTDAPVVRLWDSAGTTVQAEYQWDNVKNRYYFLSGPFWQSVNQRLTGDFVAADGSINQVIQGFRLHAILAFDICADGERPASIEDPPQTGITYTTLRTIMRHPYLGRSVEFYPHASMLPASITTPNNTFLALIDGNPDVDRANGQSVSHIQLTFKGAKVVTAHPLDF